MAKRPGSAGDPLWFKDAIIYELHVPLARPSAEDPARGGKYGLRGTNAVECDCRLGGRA